MRRRTASFTSSELLGLATAVVLLALPRAARAQDADLSGQYTVGSDSTTAQVPSWGPDCPPRPQSHQGSTGRPVSVAYNGAQITVVDGRRTLRSDGCLSDNPQVRRLTAGRSGSRWTVTCQMPEQGYQHETGNYSFTVDGARLTVRDETTFSITLNGSNCRATMTRTIVYNRVGGAPTPVATDAGAVATHARDASAPAPGRCASPGAPTRFEIAPSRRSLAPGGRACFRARALDANGCDAAGAPAASWQIARANGEPADLTIESNGCVRAPAGASQGEYNVTATAGAFTARAIAAVVSAEELRSLIAQHIEDDPNALPALQTGTASGTGVGAVVVRAPPAPPTAGGPGLAFWGLIAAAGVLAVLGVVLLVRRRGAGKPAATAHGDDAFQGSGSDPSSVSGRRRYETVPIPVRHRPIGVSGPGGGAPGGPDAAATGAGASPALAPMVGGEPSVAQPPPSEPRPLTRRCPTCNNLFTAEMAFCPEHGTPLVDVTGGDAASSAAPSPTSVAPVAIAPAASSAAPTAQPATAPAQPLRCPKCGRRYEQGIVFCGEDGTTLVADG